jgi:prevent-host-death family protein
MAAPYLTYDYNYDHNQTVIKVNVATLKAELSRYLDIAENGEQVMVTSHGKEIATIGPAHTMRNIEPVNWADFIKVHSLIKPKTKGENAAKIMRKIRDEE